MALARTHPGASTYPGGRGLASRLGGRFLESRAYAGLQRFADVLVLNALWAIAALPVITFFPATAAMFSVVRRWVNGEEPPLAMTFWRGFRDNLRQALGFQVIWTLAALGLMANSRLVGMVPAVPRSILQGLLVIVALVLAAASVYVFPLMVHYRTSWTTVLRLSLLLAIGKPATTLRCLAVVAPVVAVSVVFPPLPLLVAGLIAVVVYRWCQVALDGIVVVPGPTAKVNSV